MTEKPRTTIDSVMRAPLAQLGERLSLARKRRGLTQAELAVRMGSTARTLYRLERGDPSVSVGVLVRVLDALELERELNSVLAVDSVGVWAAQRSTPKRVRGKNRPRNK